MKNKNNQKTKFKWLLPLSAGVSLSAVVFLAVATPLVLMNNRKEASRASVNFKQQAAGPAANLVQGKNSILEKLNPGETPKNLYFIPRLNSNTDITTTSGAVTQNILNYYMALVHSFDNGGIFNALPKVSDLYLPNLQTMLSYNSTTANLFPTITDSVKSAQNNFLVPQSVKDSSDLINGFDSKGVDPKTTLKILKPKNIYSAGTLDNNGVSPDKLTIGNDFAYKVAEVDLEKLGDENSSLAFSYQDLSDQDHANHDYNLIIANENHEIKDFISDPSNLDANKNLKIRGLFDTNDIFIRDNGVAVTAKEPTTRSVPLTLGDKIIIDKVSGVGNEKKIQILIKPSNNNDDLSKSIQFSVNSSISRNSAKAPTLKMGILDYTYSTLHTKPEDPVPTNVDVMTGHSYSFVSAPLDPNNSLISSDAFGNSASPLKIFFAKANWGSNTSTLPGNKQANFQRMYILKNSHITLQAHFNNQADAWESGQNKIDLSNDTGNDLTIKQASLIITKTAENAATNIDLQMPVKFYVQDIAASVPNPEYIQVDTIVPHGLVTFFPDPVNTNDESPFILEGENMAQKIFFEDPFAKSTHTAAPTFTDKSKDVRIDAQTTATDEYLEFYGTILSNWSGFNSSLKDIQKIAPNKTLFAPSGTKLPGDANGLATFGKDLDPALKASYTRQQFVIAPDNSLLDIGTQIGIYARNDGNLTEPTFYPTALDNKKNPTDWSTPSTGQAIYQHLVSYSNSLRKWSIDRFGADPSKAGLFDQDAFAISAKDASSPGGFVDKQYFNLAGKVGTDAREIGRALVAYWNGDPTFANNAQWKDLIDKTIKPFAKDKLNINDLDLIVKGKGKTPGNTPSLPTDPYFISRQYVYYILQYQFMKVINEISSVIVKKFNDTKNVSLGDYFVDLLHATDVNIKLNSNLVTPIVSKDPELMGMDLVAVANYGVTISQSGIESLSSLLNFIKVADLETRFLDTEGVKSFDSFCDEINKLINEPSKIDELKDPTKSAQLVAYLSNTSKIVDSVVGNRASNFKSFSQIAIMVANKTFTSYDEPLKELKKSLTGIIEMLGQKSTYGTYNVLGIQGDFTYLQQLAIGKNLEETFKQYMKNNPLLDSHSMQVIQDFIDQHKQYSTNDVQQFVIAIGINNFKYFIDHMSSPKYVEDEVKSLLKSDLAAQLQIKIDSDNQFLKVVANPRVFIKYAFIATGLVAASASVGVFALTFRRFLRNSGKKSVIIERIIFGGIIVFGLLLSVIGAVPGVL